MPGCAASGRARSGPFLGADDPRDDIEGKDALGAGDVAVNIEGDPQLEQGMLGRLLAPQELARRQAVDEFAERASGGAGRESCPNISSANPPASYCVKSIEDHILSFPGTTRSRPFALHEHGDAKATRMSMSEW